MTELIKKSISSSVSAAIGSHVVQQAAEQTGWLRGRAYSMIGSMASAVLPQNIRNSISVITERTFSCLAYVTDHMQAPMNKIQTWQNDFVLKLGSFEEQQSFMARFGFINRTIIAPLVEETLYRGPQIVGGIVLEKTTGLSPVTSQAIAGIVTNTLFGLAHTVGETGMRRINSQEFVASFSKGLALAISAAIITNSRGEEGSVSLEAIAGFVTAVTAHALSNLPAAYKQYHNDINA